MNQQVSGIEQFKALMVRAGWNAAETARNLKVSPASISAYLTGDTDPPPAKVNLLTLLVDQYLADKPKTGVNYRTQSGSGDGAPIYETAPAPADHDEALKQHIAACANGILKGWSGEQMVRGLEDIVRDAKTLLERMKFK